MLVEFGLFDEDKLLERGAVLVSTKAQCSHLALFRVAYQLQGEVAKIVLSHFAPAVEAKTASLDMPVHQSSDWESIALGKYTFAFRCSLNA
ncbi:MAG: hypothetical protein JSR54_09270 [Proteobacteria bacterium]|nr:hypothetical protein [Pseudomonadota bacterium]